MTKNASTANVYRKKPVMKRRVISSLNADGSEKLDPMPLAQELIGARPLTPGELYDMFTGHGAISNQLVYDDFADEDDFLDEQDDLPENGLTPHEVSSAYARELALKPTSVLKDIARNLQKNKTRKKAEKSAAEGPSAPPPSSPAPTGGDAPTG